MKKKKKRSIKNFIRSLILLICVGVFIYSAFNLATIFYEYYRINEAADSLKSDILSKSTKKDKYLVVDWAKLKKINSDVIAWVSIPDTNINYPILRGEDNNEYLRSDINHKRLLAGCIFVDSGNAEPFTDLNTVVYGHNVKEGFLRAESGSMFADLNEYLTADFVKNHPTIYVYLPDGTVSEYKIVSAHKMDATDEVLYNTNTTDLQELYKRMAVGNVVNVEFDQSKNSPVLTLSTCATYSEHNTSRVIVHGVLERSGIDPKKEK